MTKHEICAWMLTQIWAIQKNAGVQGKRLLTYAIWVVNSMDSLFILVFNQLDAQNLFYSKFYSRLLETCRGVK